MRLAVKGLVDFVFPPECSICGCPVDPACPHSLCPSCLSKIAFVLPPLCVRCGVPFSSPAQESHLCGRCLRGKILYRRARALALFSGPMRTAIHAFKYENKTYLARALAGLTKESPVPFHIDRYDILVPVPLHKNRLRKRGYNQSLLLARELGRLFAVPVGERVLRKTRDSAPQVELTGTEREKNVKGVFSLGRGRAEGAVLLVDDVLTTGATVNECARTLLEGGARTVDVFTVARAV
ncbi:MAG: ComF family protein [Deltaproteobacteria bacterium]|nr:ComF family protein [Deltaproteobacteria bacterium]